MSGPLPLRTRDLTDSGRVRVSEVLCSSDRAPLGAEESADLPRLVLPVEGVFSCRVRGRSHTVEPGSALVLEPDEPYRFGHPADGGDACVVLALSGELWAEATERGAPGTGRVVLDPREQLRTLVFRRRARESAHDPDAVRELALLRVGEVLTGTGTDTRTGTDAAGSTATTGPGPTAAQRRLAEEAASFVAEHHTEPLPRLLDAAAAATGRSPYHLARVFRAVQGLTLHGFRERLRTASALRALAEGADDLAGLAAALGYASHSHFTGRMRATLGTTPSRVRARLGS